MEELELYYSKTNWERESDFGNLSVSDFISESVKKKDFFVIKETHELSKVCLFHKFNDNPMSLCANKLWIVTVIALG